MKFADNSTTPRRRNEPASVGDGPHFLSEDSSSHNLAEEQAETLAVAMTHNTTTIESTAPRRRGPQYYQQQQQQQQHSQSPNLVFRSEDPSRPFERDLLQRQTSSVSEEILGKEILLGLSIAGVASSILYTLFGMFHIDMFLNVYQLPLPTYSFGNLVVTMLGTVTSLVSAYIIDHIAAKSVMSNYRSASSKRARGQARVDLIGLSGCLSALYFLAPFFRWWDSGTLSDDDAQYAHNTAAVVNDNLHMSDQARVSYMASGKVASFIASFVFARIGLALFDTVTPEGANNLFQFRLFLISASVIVAGLFIKAQLTISDAASPANQYSHGRRSDNDIDIGSNHNNGGSNKRDKVSRSAGGLWRRLFLPKRDLSFHGSDDDNDDELFVSDGQTPEISVQLKWKQIIVDFWEHKNFRAWIGMEMLLEAQTTFVLYFLKTFVDGLLLENEGGVIGRQSCDWLLSAIRPLTQVVSIFIYIPIRRMGYRYVYSGLFYCNIFLSVLLLSVVDVDTPAGAYWIVFYMCTYPVLTGGVQSAGFHLAQADLVMEMKRKHILDGRYDEPSLAGLFMGANALLCKPVESFLPITAATVLQEHKESKVSLFYLLVLPPLICSCLQILSWSQFDLTPRRTARMRNEVKKLRSSALDILPMDL